MIRTLYKLLSIFGLFSVASWVPGALAKNRAWLTKTGAAFVLAVLAFPACAGAITENEQIAFAGVDTLRVRAYVSTSGDFVTERQLLTKAELVFRTSGVPLHGADSWFRSGPWLEISVVALPVEYADGRSTGTWTYGVHVQLKEILTVRRDGQDGLLGAATWENALFVGYGPKVEARKAVLDCVVEVAEDVSNLYLATH